MRAILPILLPVLFFTACERAPDANQRPKANENHSLGGTLHFRLNVHEIRLPDNLTFTDTATGKTWVYGDSDEVRGLLDTRILSPDREWVLLPIGLTEGFRFCRVRDLAQALEDDTRFARVHWPSTPTPLHYFEGWRDGSTALISLRLSGTGEIVAFDPAIARNTPTDLPEPIPGPVVTGVREGPQERL